MRGINRPMTPWYYNGLKSTPKHVLGSSVIGNHIKQMILHPKPQYWPAVVVREQALRVLEEMRQLRLKIKLPN